MTIEIATTAAPERPCYAHPTEDRRNCQPCRQAALDADRHMRDEARHEAMIEAERRMERFPLRYQPARADNPAVVEWTNLFGDNPAENLPGLLIVGATGVGKTWQAYGALRRVLLRPVKTRVGTYRPRTWQAMTYADMCASLRPRPKVDTEEVMKAYRTVEILLIDDLAAAKGSDWVEEVTYRLINGRYEDMRPTIFTSNLTVPQLREAIGDRIASRLAESCTRVAMTGDDRRRAPKEA